MTYDPAPNPYDAPTFADLPYAPPGKPPRSGWLVAICVIAMALGGLGMLKALSNFCLLPVQDQLRTAFTPPRQPGMPEELQEAQENLQKEIDAVQGGYLIASLAMAAVRLVVAGSLLYGGIMALKQTPIGRKVLTYAFACGIAFELADAVFQTAIFLGILAAIRQFARQIVESARDDGGPAPEFLVTFVTAAAWTGMIVHYVMVLAKGGFYLAGLLYLVRPDVQTQFEPPPEADRPVAARVV